jgi:hypothetical protein
VLVIIVVVQLQQMVSKRHFQGVKKKTEKAQPRQA